jgi:hypothetical protein
METNQDFHALSLKKGLRRSSACTENQSDAAVG